MLHSGSRIIRMMVVAFLAIATSAEAADEGGPNPEYSPAPLVDYGPDSMPGNEKIDIIFLLDGSSSISSIGPSGEPAPVFKLYKAGIENCIAGDLAFIPHDGTVAVAVIQFSYDGPSEIEIPLTVITDTDDAITFVGQLNEIEHQQGVSTCLGVGLDLAFDFLKGTATYPDNETWPAAGGEEFMVITATDVGEPPFDGYNPTSYCSGIPVAEDIRTWDGPDSNLKHPASVHSIYVDNVCDCPDPTTTTNDHLRMVTNTADSGRLASPPVEGPAYPDQPVGYYSCAKDILQDRRPVEYFVSVARNAYMDACFAVHGGQADCDYNGDPVDAELARRNITPTSDPESDWTDVDWADADYDCDIDQDDFAALQGCFTGSYGSNDPDAIADAIANHPNYKPWCYIYDRDCDRDVDNDDYTAFRNAVTANANDNVTGPDMDYYYEAPCKGTAPLPPVPPDAGMDVAVDVAGDDGSTLMVCEDAVGAGWTGSFTLNTGMTSDSSLSGIQFAINVNDGVDNDLFSFNASPVYSATFGTSLFQDSGQRERWFFSTDYWPPTDWVYPASFDGIAPELLFAGSGDVQDYVFPGSLLDYDVATASAVPTGTYVFSANNPTGLRKHVATSAAGSSVLGDGDTFTLVVGPVLPEKFETMQSCWTSEYDALWWGGAATWTIEAGGEQQNAMRATRTVAGSSAKVKVYDIKPNTDYEITIYMKSSGSTVPYWSETAYRLGEHSAEGFDQDFSPWEQGLLKKFSNFDGYDNGNGGEWIEYSRLFNSGTDTKLSMGFKVGSLGSTAVSIAWDELKLKEKPPENVSENFQQMPTWDSSWDASWGSAANWSITSGGDAGKALTATRNAGGSSVNVQVFPVQTSTTYTISIKMRCPTLSEVYWAETAFKLGNQTAQDFDQNSGSWTMIKKFSDSGGYDNGNGDTWIEYEETFITGENDTEVSVGYKLGSTGVAPKVMWDSLRIEQ